ncbi:hypothetical protein [Pectinatus frisingensis]|uniref:hypothetical protein n=1 Tax=Pectinatus frisingensis TaxID=865 RepID=UPI0018C51E53|nr:hypothetical protein [Pectinatus frisingensis]
MNGYEELEAAVISDCKEGEGCFNPAGCNKEATIMVPGSAAAKKMGFDMVCKHNIKCFHQYCNKFKWVIDRAKHYEEKTGISWERILNSWEENRDYWYMNYYQDCNQPLIQGDKVKVFDTVDDAVKSFKDMGFRCPICGGISKNPYECDSGKKMSKNKICDWKVYGLLGDLGKGVYIFCKDKCKGQTIFMPVAWE